MTHGELRSMVDRRLKIDIILWSISSTTPVNMLKTRAAIDFTTNKEDNIDEELEQGHRCTSLKTSNCLRQYNNWAERSFHIDVFACGKMARDESTHGIERGTKNANQELL